MNKVSLSVTPNALAELLKCQSFAQQSDIYQQPVLVLLWIDEKNGDASQAGLALGIHEKREISPNWVALEPQEIGQELSLYAALPEEKLIRAGDRLDFGTGRFRIE